MRGPWRLWLLWLQEPSTQGLWRPWGLERWKQGPWRLWLLEPLTQGLWRPWGL